MAPPEISFPATIAPAPVNARRVLAHAAPAQKFGRLVLEGVSKAFPNSPVGALENISVTCEPGEFVVVVGPSGCGKSTLLNVAAGMIHPDRGRVELDGVSVNGPGPERAMVFQDHGLFPWLTAA